MTSHLLQVQEKVTSTYITPSNNVEQEDMWPTNMHQWQFRWFFFIAIVCQKVSKLRNNNKDICTAKRESNLLQLIYSLPLKKSPWHDPKEKMTAKFSQYTRASHTNLLIINYKQRNDKSLTSFIYRWRRCLLQSCDISAKWYRDILKINLFSPQLWNGKIARTVIWKHPKTVAMDSILLKRRKKYS